MYQGRYSSVSAQYRRGDTTARGATAFMGAVEPAYESGARPMSSTTPEQQQRWLAGEARPEEALQRRYEKAHLRAVLAAAMARLLGRSTALLTLDDLIDGLAVRGAHAAGLQSVPIELIVASEGRSSDFDRRFRPLQSRTWERWRSAALALTRDAALPPVELLAVGGRYAVRDGHHRISAALLLGRHEVDALVTVIDVG